MQPVSPRVVELLNDALTFELTVTNTYFLNARMLDAWGLPKLGKVFYDLSIDEMRDADDLIQRVLLFDGHPNLQRLGAIRVGETAEEMLVLALDSEKAAVAQFNAAAQECHDLGDHGTAAVFEEMVRDEEKHADWFEAQLAAIERVGAAAVPGRADLHGDAGLTPRPPATTSTRRGPSPRTGGGPRRVRISRRSRRLGPRHRRAPGGAARPVT